MCTNGDVRRVFHSQRHAKLSGARLHGAPSRRQTETPLPLLEQMVCLIHTAQKVMFLLCGFLVVSYSKIKAAEVYIHRGRQR